MKKYLLFTPLAMSSYIWVLLMIVSYELYENLAEDTAGIISEVICAMFVLVALVTYVIGLIKMFRDERYDEFFAAKVSLYVKYPQILPGIILGLWSVGLLIAPMGFFLSIFLWIYMGIVYGCTSVVVAVACRNMYKAGKLDAGKAVLLGLFSFFPLFEYIVPVLLFIMVGKRNRVGSCGCVMQN